MSAARRLALVLASAALLGACAAPATRVVLLPQPDGRPSAVVVATDDGEETLSKPYQRATAAAGKHGAPVVDRVDPSRVHDDNKMLFDMMPPPVQRYTVYFAPGDRDLTASSRAALNDALEAALARHGGEIVLTGYTDTVGTPEHNDQLSRQRAEQVEQLFVERRFPLARITVAGRGERELAVSTGDNVDEPRNRRVTIEVR